MPTIRKNMADINSSDQALNGLKIKTDSLPDNWYVTLVNPKNGEPGENMSIARFIELLPFLLKSGGTLNGSFLSLNGYLAIDGKYGAIILYNRTSGGHFSGLHFRNVSGTYDEFQIGRYTSEVDSVNRMHIGWGDEPWSLASSLTISKDGIWYKGQSLLTSTRSANSNALTETVVEEVPVSADTPMILQEDGQLVPMTQTVERYEYSVPKMAEAILALQKEIAELKGEAGKE